MNFFYREEFEKFRKVRKKNFRSDLRKKGI